MIEEIQDYAIILLDIDGTIFWGSILIKALHDDDGAVIGFAKLTSEIFDHPQ